MAAGAHRRPRPQTRSAAPAPAPVDDAGLVGPAEIGLLTDQYELAMAASYLARDMNELAVFELFVRHLPPHRDWLLVAGLGPALALVEAMRFGPEQIRYLRDSGCSQRGST